MLTVQEKLETLFDKGRSLLSERQEAAVEALADIAVEPCARSDDEPSKATDYRRRRIYVSGRKWP
jgi:hypothetical protein